MTFTLRQMRTLLDQQELTLFETSRRQAVGSLSLGQLETAIQRSRALRDKHRDLYRRQTVQTRTGPSTARRPLGGENERTQRKAEVMADVLARFERQRALRLERQPLSPPQPRHPAPGAPATTSGAPSPAERMRRASPQAAGVTEPGAALLPMRGAQHLGQRAIDRKDRAATAAGADVVARRAAAPTEPHEGAAAQSLQAAVKAALAARQQAPALPPAPPTTPHGGAAHPSLAARPTDVTPAALTRHDPLKAEPVNQKIHAAARGSKRRFQAARDSR